MDVSLFNRMKSYITEHNRNKRWRIIVTVLAVAVSLTTAYILGTPAHTIASETYCGFEEHSEHTDECYDENGILVCEKEIHSHTLQCYSNPEADIENEKNWEQSIASAKLGDSWKENVVSVAQTQLGYSESVENFLVGDDGQIRGYNRYGAFCGDNYCDWGIAFCQFCIKYAGVTGECFENAVQSDKWINELNKHGFFRTADYTPKVGDVVFLHNKNKTENNAGIIEKVNCDNNGNVEKLEIIEGNLDDEVARTTVKVSNGSVSGYCEVPENSEQVISTNSSETAFTVNAANETNISSLYNLNNGSYCLTKDITLKYSSGGTVSFNNKNITINLNGHKITSEVNPAFRVSGGSVTFYDSQTPTDSVTTSQGTEFGKTATYNNGTLTYYVTETEVVDDDNGATQETLVKHTVTKGGMIVGTNNGRAFEVTNGGKLNLNGGYICNFKNNEGGAIYVSQNNSTVNLNGAVIAANSSNKGGAIYMNGYSTLNISSGAIAGNTADGDGGGGIYARRESWDGAGNVYATINLSGGYITNNYASNGDYWAGGGGVHLEYVSKLVMTGGYITSNKANGGGGGVKTHQDWGGNESGRVEMYGGFITANNAIGAEGGGLNINAGGSMYMEAGYITNNMAGTGKNDGQFQHWGGGGMFCSENSSSIVILNSLVTNNSAGGFGGGVAGCSTGRIKTATDSGAGIFDNEALGLHTSGGESTKNEDHYYAAENETFMSHGYQDYFCALASNISGGMLGGGAAKWEGTSDGVPVSTDNKDDVIEGSSVTGLTSHATDGDKDKARVAARSYFNGNESPTHGGGILANGYLVMGNVDKFEVFSRLQLDGLRKMLCDETGREISQQAESFEFVVVDKYGEEVAHAFNSADGSVTLDRRLAFTSAGNFTYYLYEVLSDKGGIQYDTSKYRIDVTVVEEVNGDKVPWTDIPCYYYHFSNVKVTEVTTNTVLYNGNPGNDDAHAITISPLSGRAFVNRVFTSYKETGEQPPNMIVSVSKTWASNSGAPGYIDVSLLKNGNLQETVRLNNSNHWKYTWSNLEPDATYTVSESAVDGFVPDYQYTYTYDTQTVETDNYNGALIYKLNNGYYELISNDSQLSENGKYVISSSDGKYLLAITSAHADAFLSSADKVAVTRDDTNKRYKADENIPSNCIFVCKKINRDGYNYRYLENQGVNSFPLVQIDGSSGKALKGTNSNWYSSPFRISNGRLQGQLCPDSWNSGNPWRYIIFDGSSFDSATNVSKITYEKTTAAHKNYVITNTPEDEVDYTLVIKDTEKDDKDHVLTGGVFEVKDGDTTLRFIKISDGCYEYSPDGDITQLTTSSKGKIRIIKMKKGDYTVSQISPPDGYIKSEDETATLDADTTDRSLEVPVENAKYVVVLPETGGMGVTLFYTLGTGLILCAIMCGIRIRYRRKEVD